MIYEETLLLDFLERLCYNIFINMGSVEVMTQRDKGAPTPGHIKIIS